MARRLKIPTELLTLNPNLTLKEIRTIINVVLNSRKNRMRQAHIFDVKLPALGRVRSNRNKVHKHRKKTLKRDVKRKAKENQQKELTKERLLW